MIGLKLRDGKHYFKSGPYAGREVGEVMAFDGQYFIDVMGKRWHDEDFKILDAVFQAAIEENERDRVFAAWCVKCETSTLHRASGCLDCTALAETCEEAWAEVGGLDNVVKDAAERNGGTARAVLLEDGE